MQSKLFPLLALAGAAVTVNAGSLVIQDTGDNLILGVAGQVPVCANICIFQAAVAVGCAEDDYVCQCSHKDQVFALTQSCLFKSCNGDQAQTANSLVKKICKYVKRGLPVVRRADIPPAPRALPEAPMPGNLAIRGDAATGSFAATATATGSFVSTPTASSIPSSIQSATATSSPSSVQTAGAALHKVPAAALAGVVAAAGAFLL